MRLSRIPVVMAAIAITFSGCSPRGAEKRQVAQEGTAEVAAALQYFQLVEETLYLGNGSHADIDLGDIDSSVHPSILYRLVDAKRNNDSSLVGSTSVLELEVTALAGAIGNLSSADDDYQAAETQSQALTQLGFLDRLCFLVGKLARVRALLDDPAVGINNDALLERVKRTVDTQLAEVGAIRQTAGNPRCKLETKLTAGDPGQGYQFGHAVAISSGTILVGEPASFSGTGAGAAYLFSGGGGNWNQEAKLTADDAALADHFGLAVAVSGSSAVVGARHHTHGGTSSGSAYVFVTGGGPSWSQQAELLPGDAAVGDYGDFGTSVGIDGDTIVVGAPADGQGGSASGAAYVFGWNGSAWTLQAKLLAGDAKAYDRFGGAVAISGDTIAVGAWAGDDDAQARENTGAVYVFVRSGTTWAQQAKLVAGDSSDGDRFGESVALAGDALVAGAHLDDDAGDQSGSAYIFRRSSAVWSQEAKLTASDSAANDDFGLSVGIEGDHVVVGARSAGGHGAAYVFSGDGLGWTEVAKLVSRGGAANDHFGISVAISDGVIVAGAWLEDVPDVYLDSGAAWVFEGAVP